MIKVAQAEAEADVAADVEKYLNQHRRHCIWFKVHGHAQQAKRLDYIIGWYGHYVELELKEPGKTPDPYQLEIIHQVNRRGSVAFWADSVETVKFVLEDLIRERL